MLRDSDNIEFRNLHFFSGSLRTVYCDYFVIEDSKFSFSSDMKANLPNQVRYGEYGILRNTIFENMNSSAPWQFSSNMYPLIENVMFNKTEWFRGTTSYPMVGTNYRGALKDYNKAIILSKDNELYYFKRANIYYKLKQYNKAKQDYNNAIEINNKKMDNFFNRSIVFNVII